MKNYELLDMIGQVNEDYVQAADAGVVRPRLRWKALAACAACAALIAAAYPAFMASRPDSFDQNAALPLHPYTVMEGGGGEVLTQKGEVKAPAGGTAPAPAPGAEAAINGADAGGSFVYGDGPGADGDSYSASSQDAPVEEGPYDQYNSLYENARLDQYPDWYGGAYNDYNSSGEPAKLVVCVVEGFRTPELERQIAAWCGGGEQIYRDVKYSRGFLQTLMERLNSSEFLEIAEGDGAASSCGVYEEDNCIRMDCHDIPGEAVLAALAELDPDGDAIQIRVFAGQTVNPYAAKGPVTEPAQYSTQPAQLDGLPEYDLIYGAED